jgi:hypothetical protein
MTFGEQLHNTPTAVQLLLLGTGLICGGLTVASYLWGKLIIMEMHRNIATGTLNLESVKANHAREVEYYKTALKTERDLSDALLKAYDERDRQLHHFIVDALYEEN